MPIATTVQQTSFNYKIDNSKPGASLAHSGRPFNHGLTSMTPLVKCKVRFGYTSDKKQYFVQSVRVILSYEPVSVCIAREYPRGSCEYQHTLAHELLHVQDMRETMAAMVQQAPMHINNAANDLLTPIPTQERPTLLYGTPPTANWQNSIGFTVIGPWKVLLASRRNQRDLATNTCPILMLACGGTNMSQFRDKAGTRKQCRAVR